jgi:DNA-binding NarL/FixJ family response regulator
MQSTKAMRRASSVAHAASSGVRFVVLASLTLTLSARTARADVQRHVSQIYAKCGVGSRAELFRLLYRG